MALVCFFDIKLGPDGIDKAVWSVTEAVRKVVGIKPIAGEILPGKRQLTLIVMDPPGIFDVVTAASKIRWLLAGGPMDGCAVRVETKKWPELAVPVKEIT